jgi:hypothetical protein
LYERIAKKLGRSTTYSSEIEKVGSQLLGSNWGGVHAADTLPPVSENFQCYVCNVATTTDGSGGIHWLACVDQGGKRYFNDPLGTAGKAQATTLRRLHSGAQWAEMDAEQKKSQKDCGVRALVTLKIAQDCGLQCYLDL